MRTSSVVWNVRCRRAAARDPLPVDRGTAIPIQVLPGVRFKRCRAGIPDDFGVVWQMKSSYGQSLLYRNSALKDAHNGRLISEAAAAEFSAGI